MPKSDQPSTIEVPTAEEQTLRAYLGAEHTQLAIQIRLLDGRKHIWPYAHLSYHVLEGGKLTIAFSEHLVIVRGRHLEGASESLGLQSLVYLQETGTRRQEELGEPDLPEDQPAVDSIKIYDRSRD